MLDLPLQSMQPGRANAYMYNYGYKKLPYNCMTENIYKFPHIKFISEK